MRYIVVDENELVLYRDLVLSDTGLGEGVDRIKFMQDDANNLKPVYTGYDLIILPNVLEELSCPVKFLTEIHTRLNPGGRLLIASDYDWSTVQSEANSGDCSGMPGGFKKDGEPVSSLEGIASILSSHFTKEGNPEELIRHERFSSRRWMLRRCEITFWRLKE